MADLNKIRNFSIIAHIDHGKSTLADRLLEATHTIEARDLVHAQLLDAMDLEQERGITIKAHPVRMIYKANDGEEYELNLIDTPGHVDFTYEVSRSIAACEGAILIIDATQGVQAQTVANVNLAFKHNLKIIPVINKIDLPASDLNMCYEQLEEILAIPREEAIAVSAKEGTGIPAVLEAIVKLVPPPKGAVDKPTNALIFDSIYDAYRGVVTYVRVYNGGFKRGDKLRLLSTGLESEIKEVGVFTPEMKAISQLTAGSVGYLIPNIKSPSDTKIGDTVTEVKNPCTEPLPGFQEIRPMVFSGIYPIDTADYEQLKFSMAKLQLNDAAFVYQPETSAALGFGFRCGFLGLLHMEIIQERLEREYNLDLITTAPSVIYRVTLTNGEVQYIDNPTNYPDPAVIAKAEEPMVKAEILTPADFVGNVMELCQNRRGVFVDMQYLDDTRVALHYVLPLNEIVYDFFDVLKSRTRGYASFDYELSDYMESKLVKLDVLLNGEIVDALSFIIHTDKAYERGRKIVEKLKENIPRQLFEVPVQAAIGGKIIARETIKAMRKDVLAKCYGGDITRKKKLLEKQKEGKKRMRQLGSVEVPQEAFMSVLKLDSDN